MRKVTKAQQKQINLLMLATINSYINCFATKDSDLQSLQMYADDVANNVNALTIFNSNLCADTLQNNIMQQDTLVREYFIAVLQYLEKQQLVTHSVCL